LFSKSLIHYCESLNNVISLFFFCIYLIRFELCFTELIKSLKAPIKSTMLHRINILFVLIKSLNQVRIWSPSFLVWFVRQAWAKKLWSFESPSFIKVDGSLKKLAWHVPNLCQKLADESARELASLYTWEILPLSSVMQKNSISILCTVATQPLLDQF